MATVRVWNDSRWTLSCPQLGNKQIKGQHFIVVSEEASKRVPQNGVFRIEVIEDKSTRGKKKEDPNAHLEQLGDKPSPFTPGNTQWFAGRHKAK